MGGGSWLGGGDTPCHPSAWCKSTQGWANVINVSQNQAATLQDIKAGHNALRLWTEGQSGKEYFLAETRFRKGFDRHLPAEGLLLWHIDENVPDNSNEHHLKVALVQADGTRDLETKRNDGDPNDAFPGGLGIAVCDHQTTPHTRGYSGAASKVALSGIALQGNVIGFNIKVHS
jgi:immune inhibitor A